MPIHQFVDEPHLAARGLRNYWGYNSLGYFAPHAAYAATGTRGGQVSEFKQMVRALHAAGIEVILDVVYNHTAKAISSARRSPSAASTTARYYRLRDGGQRYTDYTGMREHPERAATACAPAHHRLAAVLGDRDGGRRLPLRPSRRTRSLDA